MFEHLPLQGKQEVIKVDYNELDTADFDIEQQVIDTENEQIKQLVEHIWDSYEFDNCFEELESVLGSRKIQDNYYLLANNSRYGNKTDPFFRIPGVTKLGARSANCEFTRQIQGTNIVGLKGKMLLYRTSRDEPNQITYKKGKKLLPTFEKYHEAGFFCFITAEKDPETGIVTPFLSFGDIDKANWPTEATKIKAMQLLNGSNFQFGYSRYYISSLLQDFDEFEESLFGEGRARILKSDIKPGIFTQNKEALINNPLEQYNSVVRVRNSMQAFINLYAKPEQVKSDERVISSPQASPINDSVYREIDQKHFELDWQFLHEAEHAELPMIQAVGSLYRWYEEEENIDIVSIIPIKRAIGIILKDADQDEIWERLHSSNLSDEDVKLVYSLENIIKTMVFSNRRQKSVSLIWKHALKTRPDLFPGVTEERLLNDPELVSSLQYNSNN